MFRNLWIPAFPSGLQETWPLSIGGKNILACGGENPRMFENACTHRGSKLVEKKCKASKFTVCPYHFWKFDMRSGSVVRTPRIESDCEFKENHKLRQFPLKKLCHLHVGYTGNEAAHPDMWWSEDHAFTQKMNRLNTGSFEVVRTGEFNVTGNWKLIVENFLDFLHVPSIHPTLNNSSAYEHHIHDCTDGLDHIAFRTEPTTPGTPIYELKDAGNALYFDVLFPNYFQFADKAHVFGVFVNPISPGETVESAFLSVRPGAATPKQIEQLWDFYSDVNKEDIAMVERVHRGLQGGKGDRHMQLVDYVDQHLIRFRDLLRQKETEFETATAAMHNSTPPPMPSDQPITIDITYANQQAGI